MRLARAQRSAEPAPITDAELVGRASKGDVPAFEELYRRHVQAAWRVAQAVTGDASDAADAVAEAFTKVLSVLPAGRLDDGGAAFRPYLLTATRNAAVDVLRRRGRTEVTNDVERFERLAPATAATAAAGDTLIDKLDASLVAAAFRTLPERWRSILWLTEVEGIPPREVAERLGISANGASQLAVRARAGLRERFLQAHLRGDVAAACRPTVELLGAHVVGALAPRDVAKVDQHLAGCEACRARRDDLEEVGTSLRRAVLPLPLALGPLALSRFKLGTGAALTVRDIVPPGAQAVLRLEKPLAGTTMSILALGFIGLAVVSQAGPKLVPDRPAAEQAQLLSTPVVGTGEAPGATRTIVYPTSEPDDLADQASSAITTPPSSTTSTTVLANEGDDDIVKTPPTTVPTPPTTVPAKPVAQVNVAIAAAPATAAVAAGTGTGACTGATVLATTVGCAPPKQEKAPGATISTGGTALPGQTIKPLG